MESKEEALNRLFGRTNTLKINEPDELEVKYYKDISDQVYGEQFQEIIKEEETVKKTLLDILGKGTVFHKVKYQIYEKLKRTNDVNINKFMGKKIPKYLKEDFPNGGAGNTGACQSLIQKVGDDAKYNILHPGYPAEILDKQIKHIFKNNAALERVQRRKRNLARQQSEDMQRALMSGGSLHESTIPMNHNPYMSNAVNLTVTQNSIEDLNQPILLDNSIENVQPNTMREMHNLFNDNQPYVDIKKTFSPDQRRVKPFLHHKNSSAMSPQTNRLTTTTQNQDKVQNIMNQLDHHKPYKLFQSPHMRKNLKRKQFNPTEYYDRQCKESLTLYEKIFSGNQIYSNFPLDELTLSEKKQEKIQKTQAQTIIPTQSFNILKALQEYFQLKLQNSGAKILPNQYQKNEESPEVISRIIQSLEQRRIKRENDRRIDSQLYSDSKIQSPFEKSRLSIKLKPISENNNTYQNFLKTERSIEFEKKIEQTDQNSSINLQKYNPMFDLSYNPHSNSPLLDGLDLMNMSKKEVMDSIGRVYIKQHMLSRRIQFLNKNEHETTGRATSQSPTRPSEIGTATVSKRNQLSLSNSFARSSQIKTAAVGIKRATASKQ